MIQRDELKYTTTKDPLNACGCPSCRSLQEDITNDKPHDLAYILYQTNKKTKDFFRQKLRKYGIQADFLSEV